MRVYYLTFLVSRFNLYTVFLILNRIKIGFHIHLVVYWSLFFRTWNGFGLQPLSSPDQVLQLNPDSSEVLLKPISAGSVICSLPSFYLNQIFVQSTYKGVDCRYSFYNVLMTGGQLTEFHLTESVDRKFLII